MHAHGQNFEQLYNRGRMYASARAATPSVAASVAALTPLPPTPLVAAPGTIRHRIAAARRSSASPGRSETGETTA